MDNVCDPCFATPYRVSTITCNGSLGKNIGELYLDKLFEQISITEDKNAYGFIYIVDREGKVIKGTSPKKPKKTHAKKFNEEDLNKKRRFDNAISGYFQTKDGYFPSVKIFKNGTIQMTGIKKIEDGELLHRQVFEVFSTIIKKHPDTVKNNELQLTDFFVRLINSDFSVPFHIRRKDLHQLLISDQYENTSSFQPGTYPGVKLQYCWNPFFKKNDGRCYCTVNKCFGKGDGSGDGQCKKITVSIFESGKILITGAINFIQIDKAYNYIGNILKTHQPELQKLLPPVRI
jgi:TATA-box binding protein (TBP) (component of TFIID and TFIIIB)